MPELPEVETVVRELRPLLIGKRLTAVRTSKHSLRTKWSKAWEARLVGNCVGAIRRRGKWILVDLDVGGLLVLHLGMTGQLRVVPTASDLENHTHLTFDLDEGGEQWRFRDTRRFGSAVLYQDEKDWAASLGQPLGPEPFDLKAADWRRSLQKTQRSLKAVLLDQSVVAGVGNIYADESLFKAKLPPTLAGQQTSSKEAECLRRAIVDVLIKAIEGRGSTIRNYIGGSGLRGSYQHKFQVYGRTGKPCSRCGTSIASIRLAGRSTHFCPKCQTRKPEVRG